MRGARARLTTFVLLALAAACRAGSADDGSPRADATAAREIVGGAAGAASAEGNAGAGGSGTPIGGNGGAAAGASGSAGAPADTITCPLPVPDDLGTGLCGVGACTSSETCYAPLNEPPYIAQACTCEAGAWVCTTKMLSQTMYTRADGCAEGPTPSTWLAGYYPSSLWLTDKHLYVTHHHWLLRAKLPCGEPELVGSFSDDPIIVGSLPEGLVLSEPMPPLGPSISPHPVWLFRPRGRLVERRDELAVGTVSMHAGEVHTTNESKQRISFSWGAAPIVRGPLAPQSAWLFAVGEGFTVQALPFFSYQPVLHIASNFYADDGSHQEQLQAAYAGPPRGLSLDGHLFINDHEQVVELLPSGARVATGVVGSPIWVDACQIITSVYPSDSPLDGKIFATPRTGGDAKWLADLSLSEEQGLVAGPRHIAWWKPGVGVRFRTR